MSIWDRNIPKPPKYNVKCHVLGGLQKILGLSNIKCETMPKYQGSFQMVLGLRGYLKKPPIKVIFIQIWDRCSYDLFVSPRVCSSSRMEREKKRIAFPFHSQDVKSICYEVRKEGVWIHFMHVCIHNNNNKAWERKRKKERKPTYAVCS